MVRPRNDYQYLASDFEPQPWMQRIRCTESNARKAALSLGLRRVTVKIRRSKKRLLESENTGSRKGPEGKCWIGFASPWTWRIFLLTVPTMRKDCYVERLSLRGPRPTVWSPSARLWLTFIHELAHIVDYWRRRRLRLKMLGYDCHSKTFQAINWRLYLRLNRLYKTELSRIP